MATRRGYFREELRRSQLNLMAAHEHLLRVILAYEQQHPEISSALISVDDALEKCNEAIKAVHDNI